MMATLPFYSLLLLHVLDLGCLIRPQKYLHTTVLTHINDTLRHGCNLLMDQSISIALHTKGRLIC